MSSPTASAASSLTDRDWNLLMRRIQEGQCTPFLGAGVNGGLLPLGGKIAEDWALEHGYPLPDRDLAKVAQFLALTGPDRVYPKSLIQDAFSKTMKEYARQPQFPLPAVVRELAGIPLPIFLTTNYDDFMYRALRDARKASDVEICCWNEGLKNSVSVTYRSGDPNSNPVFGPSHFDSRDYEPTGIRPLVYHIHGHYRSIDSMVLTENDYFDFLVQLSRDKQVLPPRIQEAFARSSLIFLGYSLADYNFRVLFRGLVHSFPENRRLSVSIQLEPTRLEEAVRPRAMEFLTEYFKDISIKVYWGSAEAFMEELGRRWKIYEAENGNG